MNKAESTPILGKVQHKTSKRCNVTVIDRTQTKETHGTPVDVASTALDIHKKQQPENGRIYFQREHRVLEV